MKRNVEVVRVVLNYMIIVFDLVIIKKVNFKSIMNNNNIKWNDKNILYKNIISC